MHTEFQIHLFIVFESEAQMRRFAAALYCHPWEYSIGYYPPNMNVRGKASASMVSRLYEVIANTEGIRFNSADITSEINGLDRASGL